MTGPLLSGPGWLAAVANPSPTVVIREVSSAVRGLLRTIFWTNSFSGATPGSAHGLAAVAAAVVGGLAQGLPLAGLGQSFAWPYLLHWATAPLPVVAPAQRCAVLLGSAAGLAVLLRAEWRALWAGGTSPGAGARPTGAPGVGTLLAAVVPAFALRWLLRGLSGQLLAAATVGGLLLCTAGVLRLAQGWDDEGHAGHTAVPPWLAGISGCAAGLAAFPGVSGLAMLLAGLLYGRVGAAAASRFALMATTGVTALLGLAALPAAVAGMGLPEVTALLGAALGAAAGGHLLLRWSSLDRHRLWPVLAGYCAAVGGLLLLFGVFAA